MAVPTIFYHSLINSSAYTSESNADVEIKSRSISRAIAIIMMLAYFLYLYYQFRSHHSIINSILEKAAEQQELEDLEDAVAQVGRRDRRKLTLTECCLSLVISVALVTVLSIGLVGQLGYIVEEHHVSDLFLGLILVPLCEKAAEHLSAVEEAYENRMTVGLYHVLNATLQTTFFTAPLAVIVGWGLDLKMDFNFDTFNIVMLILAILAVGNFTRDQKSNYLEGFLCLVIYASIAVGAWYFPNPEGEGAGH